jgi:YD repeat-containing protein
MTSGAVGSAHGRVAVGHPVDVASGEFFAVDIDHELSGVVPLSLGRTFNTRFVRKPLLESIGSDVAPWLPFGRGWRPTWFAELRQVLDGFLYTRADGTEFSILDPRGDKSFAATGRIHSAGDGLELQRVDGARVRVVGYGRDRNENALVFERWSDRQYRLVAIERTREARIDIVYDLQGRPSRLVQRRERRSYELVYEGERVTRVALHLPDRTVRTAADYAYDARGRLVTVHDARGVAALYEYDDEDRIERDEKRGGSVYTVRYGRDGRCAYACGTNGYEERALRYDTTARKTWVTDSHGGVTLYEWNDRGQVIKSTSPTGEVTRAEFDELGRPKTEALATGELRSRTYDAVGRLIILASSFGWEQRRTYDEEHRPVVAEEWTALNADEPVRAKVMRYAYDADNNLASVQYEHLPPWSYAWTPFGELACATDPSGARRSWEHDELGQVARATNADGHTWWWTHDPRGRVITETDPLGHVRRVEHLDDESLNLRVHDPDGLVYQRHTSTDERLVRLVFPGGASRTTQLNSCGWPIAVWDEVGACTRLTWGTEPGELASIVDANGATYTFEYDAAHRVVRRVTFDGRLLLTEWAQGRVIATVDGAGQRTELKYDGRGHVVEQLRVS